MEENVTHTKGPFRFLQIHTLTSYSASLLNRDDVGFAKRIPFGGVTRTRISSQCLKRHWRVFDGEHALKDLLVDNTPVPMSIRSRLTFQREILDPLIQRNVDPELARVVTEQLMDEVFQKSEKAKKKDEDAKAPHAAALEGESAATGSRKPRGGKKSPTKEAHGTTPASLETNQVTVLGRPEVDFLLQEAVAVANDCKSSDAETVKKALAARLTKERRANLRALRLGSGLDAALFGRMVTSDILARGDGAIHVAHPMTVHAEAAESDYFSVVDELKSDGDLGAGHINTAELTTGLYYGYVVVDLPLLVSNLEGCERGKWANADRSLSGNVVESLVHLVATVSPGAKKGSTAPYAYSHLTLVEAGNAQPRTLANAFLSPVRPDGDLIAASYRRLAEHVTDMDAVHGSTVRQLAALGPKDLLKGVAKAVSRAELATWVKQQVTGS